MKLDKNQTLFCNNINKIKVNSNFCKKFSEILYMTSLYNLFLYYTLYMIYNLISFYLFVFFTISDKPFLWFTTLYTSLPFITQCLLYVLGRRVLLFFILTALEHIN